MVVGQTPAIRNTDNCMNTTPLKAPQGAACGRLQPGD